MRWVVASVFLVYALGFTALSQLEIAGIAFGLGVLITMWVTRTRP